MESTVLAPRGEPRFIWSSGSVRGHKDKVRKTVQLIEENFSFLDSDKSPRFKRGQEDEEEEEDPSVFNFDFGIFGHQNRDDKSEKQILILYSTSMAVIRNTFEDSNKLRSILQRNWIDYEERDIYLNKGFRIELQRKLKKAKSWKCKGQLLIPSLFLGSRLLGVRPS